MGRVVSRCCEAVAIMGASTRAAKSNGCVPSGFKVAGPSHIAPHPAPIMEDESMNTPDMSPDILDNNEVVEIEC